jgi:superfamily II DNA or RNA helicase
MVNITIDNYIRINGLPKDAFHAVRERLTYPNPDYERAIKYGTGKARFIPRTIRSYDIEDKEMLLPRGIYMELLGFLARVGLPFQIEDKRVFKKVKVPEQHLRLRSYQEKLIQEGLLYPGPGFILRSPPGTGKTIAGLEFARRQGRKTLWIAHKRELALQAVNVASKDTKVSALGLPKSEIGIIGMGKFEVGKFLTVATVQTLNGKKRAEEIAKLRYEFGTVVIDEIHHAPASTWQTSAHQFAPAITLGLTATSYRADGLTKLLFDCAGPVVATSDPELLLSEGVIVVPKYCLLYTGLQYSGSTYHSIIDKLINDPKRNSILVSIISDVLKQNPHNVVLLLSGRVKHVEDLTALCRDQGLDPLMLIGTLSKVERNLAYERLKSQHPRLLLATYELLSEGFDYPPISHIFFGTPFKNPIRLEQSTGRGQRVYPDKKGAYMIDATDENAMLRKQSRDRIELATGLGMPIINYTPQLFGVTT